MKKRSFLIPVATLLSVLSASNVEAVELKSLGFKNSSNEALSSSFLESNNAFDFIMVQGDYVDVTARHRSHSSHRSHRSHFSSRR